MDETEIKHVLEAALLGAGRPLTLDRLGEIFSAKGSALDRPTLKGALEALAAEYAGRGIELKEVASGYRIQIRRSMTDWLTPLWEERAPRYTRALLETLALIAYRQPITRGEIEEVRGVVVSTNIVRTLLERGWIRVVGHRDVPGKPEMFGTTREFLDYFGLKRLEDLPTLVEIKDGLPELSPQTDLIESLEAEAALAESADGEVVAAAANPDGEALGLQTPTAEATAEPSQLESVAASDETASAEPAVPLEAKDAEAALVDENGVEDDDDMENAISVVARFEDPQIEETGFADRDDSAGDDSVVIPLRKAQGTADSYE